MLRHAVAGSLALFTAAQNDDMNDDDEPSRISQALSGTSLSSELDGGSRPDFSTLSSIESLTLSRSST